MPYIDTDDSRLYYEEAGSGTPLLLIAPGGMHQFLAGHGLESNPGAQR